MNAVAELDAMMSKDSWTAEDCLRLNQLCGEAKEAAGRFRQLVGGLRSAEPKPAGAAAVKQGVAYYMLCRFAEALALLVQGTDNKERRFYQALCHKQLRQYDKALESFQHAEDRGWDAKKATFERAETQCLAGDLAGAAKSLDRFAKRSQDDPQWHYLTGMVAEMQGDYASAVSEYETARRLSPSHPGATFRLAYYYDLHGEEEQAAQLYRECVTRTPGGAEGAPSYRPIHANALLNLAVLYDDAGLYEDAARLLRRLLAANPEHARARLFLKDVLACKTMVFDEDEAKRTARRNDLLGIPVTDFELSVRARNCLKKMNIRTLGDLLHVTEPELLSYKNFGETSLAEIKQMLSSKSLRLGQMREDVPLEGEEDEEGSGATVGNEGILATPIAQIEFSVRARKALERLSIRTLGELASKTEAELLDVRNFGQTSLNEVVQRLGEYGLRLNEPQ